jgi:peptide/nickel transport system substrate-binding protein
VNGRVFTAKDVAYSLMRQAGKPGVVEPQEAARYLRAQQFVGLEKAEAVDDTTVRVTFSRPNGAFMNVLADPRAQMIPVEQDEVGWRDPLKLVGTGAWMQTEFIQGQRETFKANPEYYRSWDEGGRPGFDTHEQIVIADRASTLAAFLSGQISRFDSIRPEEEEQLKSRLKGLQRYESMGFTCSQLIFNVTIPQFKDQRVLKAMQLMIDYPSLNDPDGKWTHAMITHPYYPEAFRPDEISKLPGYNTATKQQDIAEGVRMMEAAGFKEGAGWSWIFHGASSDAQLRLIDQFRKVLPRADVKPGAGGDSVTLQNKLASGDFHANIFGPTNGTDIATDLRTYYHPEALNGGRNNTKVSLPWVDETLDKLLLAQTLQERTAIVRPFLDRWNKEGPPHIFTRGTHVRYALQPNVGGFDMTMGPFAYPGYIVAPRWLWQTEA